MATVLARTATRSLRVSTRRWAHAALQLRCKSTARCVRLSRNKNAAASQNAIPVSKSHLSALSLNARSLYDDDDDDLRFAGMSGGKLVHEAEVASVQQQQQLLAAQVRAYHQDLQAAMKLVSTQNAVLVG